MGEKGARKERLHWTKLDVWRHAHNLALNVYSATAAFPREEIYGITSQLRRAASSVPANIVEGHSRKTTREYIHFLYNARASLEEVRYFLLLAKDLSFLPKEMWRDLEEKCGHVSRMLNGLIKSLKANLPH
ncbi:MAG: four helix bundle protein [Desulfacinum sp.]|jgi:four helix bundle protein|nr:four helix bundle protein [Desulfacinum sp.]